MGLNFKDLTVRKEISLKDLTNKTLAIDASNYLYQFLTTIRNRDGTPFTDSHGQVTSHLIGLFNRTTKLMESNLKLIFVFDGPPPEIKQRTRQLRRETKEQAQLKFKEAEAVGDLEAMHKFAGRAVSLTPQIIEDAQKLISYLGLPLIQAPSEAEAQCAHLVKKGDAYASVSQDYDSLIFGCPLLIRNLSLEGKRKRAGKFAYQMLKPELLSLADNLNHLGLDLDQLIVLAILIGTDYNPGGIKGIGPKTALKLVKENPHDFDQLFQQAEWPKHFPELDWKEIFYTIKKIPLTDSYSLEWQPPDEKKILQFLIKEHDFSEERVNSKLKKLLEEKKKSGQKGLNGFFP